MKKMAILLSLVMLLLLAGCKSSEEKTSSVSPTADSPTLSSAPLIEEKVKIGVVKGTDVGLNLRKEASTDADVLAVADDGTYLLLATQEKVGDWYHVKYKDTAVYVSADFFEIKEVTASEASVLLSGKEKTPEAVENSANENVKAAETTAPEKTAEPKENTQTNDGE